MRIGRARAARSLLLLAGLAAAAAWQPDSYPAIADTASCHRSGVARTAVCDPDDVLTPKTRDYVDGVINAIAAGEPPYKQGPCAGQMEGYQVAVAVMRQMDIPAGSTPSETAADFAKRLHTRWGVGNAACNNGVLLLLSVDDRQVYINTGEGAHKALPDDLISDILADMRPQLRAQDYSAAVERGVVDIGLGLAGGKPKGEGLDWFAVAFFGVFAAVFGNAALKSFRKKREYRECRKMLAKLKREQENLRSHAWSCPQSCPICLEDFTVQPRGKGDKRDKASEDADSASSSSAAAARGNGASGSSGLDAEAGPSTSLLHGGSATSEEEFARMSAAGRAAVRRLRQRRRAAEPGGSGGGAGGSGGWADGAGPSTAAAGGGAGGGEEAKRERVPVTLGCGHTFCEPCIETWLDKGTTCPVCRKPISEGSATENSGGEEQCPSRLRQQQQQRLADDWLATDLAFRLGVLQMRYPTYITPSMVDNWTAEAQSTGSFNWETSRDFQLTDPAARHHYENSGSGGMSHGFGGGSGFGGGGGGSSW